MSKNRTIAEMISLQGKRALITGAAAGIGKEIALRFAEAGATLDLVDLQASSLTTLAKKLSEKGADVRTYGTDVSSAEEIRMLWDEVGKPVPDILVNNAGIYPFKDFTDIDKDFVLKVMDTNLHSVTWNCYEMIQRRGKLGGVIVNMGSIEAILPFKEDLAIYSVSKAGVIALTRALAKEHARHGFRVNAIVPGGVVTQGTRAAAKGVLQLRFGLLKTGWDFRQRLPAARFAQPDEVARMALVLASDLASYVHGTAIPVDGGFLSA
jgi:NAD(P)-dependent dehydrogenase (short-subunit alcohol dehydrogenase family)